MMTRVLVLVAGILAAANVASAVPSQRLVNGDVAEYGQFPWMVSLRITASSSHTCGGTLVTPQHVVSAAHCLANNVPITHDPATRFVVSGQLSNLEGGRVSRIEAIRIHPEYNASTSWRNDIGVIKLVDPIPFTATEWPIPIATADVGVQSCVASGWGLTYRPGSALPSQLQTQVLDTMTRETCTQFWSESQIFDTTLCVGGVRGYGVCSGDSGGPLICNGELAGVVSWGNPCANGMPDAFARVYLYREWLFENIADVTPLGRIYQAKADKFTLQASLQ